MRERKSRHGSGNADGKRGVLGLVRVGFASLIKEDCACRRSRRGLAIVDRRIDPALGEMDQHVAAAADIAGPRIGHRERETRRHGRVDRIAALLEHFDTDACCAAFLRNHDAVGRRHRLDGRAARGCDIGKRGRLCRQRPDPGQACEQEEQRGAGDADHLASSGRHWRTLGSRTSAPGRDRRCSAACRSQMQADLSCCRRPQRKRCPRCRDR